ncbi:hypothetical protein [Streptomyces scabiei]|uniref:hypothetical protein n=1 Tax=Streptomyces scabiei TaxID=1930 RepID=UPI0029A3B3E3|nr:hypothetical protein [Streptomyces scabiei]MDX3521146.1 hypothetical protein [Streptomyces scabiei]
MRTGAERLCGAAALCPRSAQAEGPLRALPPGLHLREEGRGEERIASVLRTLDRRHIDVPDSVRQRVRNCTDPDLLRIWVDRAYDVTDAAELFDDDQA